MARFSERQLKAINDNSINNALDDFRATSKSTYPDIDVHGPLASFERVVTDSGECRFQLCTYMADQCSGRTLILRFILQLLPTASTLHFKDGHTSLSGEIALLYASLSSNQTKFEHTIQLLSSGCKPNSHAFWMHRRNLPTPQPIRLRTPL